MAQHLKAQLLEFLIQSGRLLCRFLVQPHTARCRNHHLTNQCFLIFHCVWIFHNIFPLQKANQLINCFRVLRIKNSILRNSIRFTQILTAPEMDIAVAKLLNSLIMLLVIRRVKKAGIFLCNEKRSSVIHLHRRFKQQKQIVPAALRPIYRLIIGVGSIIFTNMN